VEERVMPTCPKCGRRVKEGVRFCPFCGQKVEAQIQPEVRGARKLPWVLIIVFVALAVTVSTLLLLRSGKEESEFTLSFVREWNYLENDPTYKAVQYYWKCNYGGSLSLRQEDSLKGLAMARPEIPRGAAILDVQISYLDPEHSCGYVTVFYRYSP
jgi:hypothetical protein